MFHPLHYQLKNASVNMPLESRFAPSAPDTPRNVSAQEAAGDRTSWQENKDFRYSPPTKAVVGQCCLAMANESRTNRRRQRQRVRGFPDA